MKKTFLFIFVCFFYSQLHSQSDTSLVVITLENRTYFTGHIEQEDSTSITFRTTGGIRMIIPCLPNCGAAKKD